MYIKETKQLSIIVHVRNMDFLTNRKNTP